jgi:hypothetical protein
MFRSRNKILLYTSGDGIMVEYTDCCGDDIPMSWVVISTTVTDDANLDTLTILATHTRIVYNIGLNGPSGSTQDIEFNTHGFVDVGCFRDCLRGKLYGKERVNKRGKGKRGKKPNM